MLSSQHLLSALLTVTQEKRHLRCTVPLPRQMSDTRRDGICSAERQTHLDMLILQKSRRQVRSEDTSLPPDDCNADLLRGV